MIYGYVYETGKREINEDAILFRCSQLARGELFMAGIFDGMGGMEFGDKAVYESVKLFDRFYDETILPIFTENEHSIWKLYSIIKTKGFNQYCKVNRLLFDEMRRQKGKMGTTASILIGYQNYNFLFHIGDTRIYFSYSFFQKTIFLNLTKNHGEKNKLTKCLGLNKEWKPDFAFFIGHPIGILLCTDGFYHAYDPVVWSECLNSNRMTNTKSISKRLKKLAKWNLQMKETDNMSALYLKKSERREIYG